MLNLTANQISGFARFANRLDQVGAVRLADNLDSCVSILKSAAMTKDPAKLMFMYDKLNELLSGLGNEIPRGYGKDIKVLKMIHDEIAGKVQKPRYKIQKNKPAEQIPWAESDDVVPLDEQEVDPADIQDITPPPVPAGADLPEIQTLSKGPVGTVADEETLGDKLFGKASFQAIVRVAQALDEAGETSLASKVDQIAHSLISEAADTDTPPTNVADPQNMTIDQDRQYGPETRLQWARRKLEQLQADFKKELSEGRTETAQKFYPPKLQQWAYYIQKLEQQMKVKPKETFTEKNKAVQKQLNQLMSAQGKPAVSKADGIITPAEKTQLLQIAPGYEQKGWAYLTDSLNGKIQLAMQAQKQQLDTAAKTTDPNIQSVRPSTNVPFADPGDISTNPGSFSMPQR